MYQEHNEWSYVLSSPRFWERGEKIFIQVYIHMYIYILGIKIIDNNRVFVLICHFSLISCTLTPTGSVQEINDKWENLN